MKVAQVLTQVLSKISKQKRTEELHLLTKLINAFLDAWLVYSYLTWFTTWLQAVRAQQTKHSRISELLLLYYLADLKWAVSPTYWV